jgi:23S rRNA pseudouridine1911/1915/1917 synthase
VKIVPEVPGRIDKLLADACPQYSRAALAKLFDLDLVKLDGRIVKAGHKVRVGSVIDADITPLDQDQQVIQLPILYEDDNVIVINKPAGIISHARGRYWFEPSVASFVRWKVTGGEKLKGIVVPNATHIPDELVTMSYPLKADQDGVDRMGIVHRLDRATSGVMVCAKNEQTLRDIQKQFADRKVEKTYVAVLTKTPKDNKAIIDAPIERNPIKPSQFRVGPNGKSAQTYYEVLRTGDSGRALVLFQPKTGRTHQLRVHALYIGCPILGDTFYGTLEDRLYLHANKLTLSLEGKQVTFESPLPKEFEDAL